MVSIGNATLISSLVVSNWKTTKLSGFHWERHAYKLSCGFHWERHAFFFLWWLAIAKSDTLNKSSPVTEREPFPWSTKIARVGEGGRGLRNEQLL